MAQKTMISLQISEDLLARMTELPSVVDPVISELLAEMSSGAHSGAAVDTQGGGDA